jgi:hypothetical protein
VIDEIIRAIPELVGIGLFALLLLVVFVGLPAAYVMWLDRQRFPAGHCRKCGYNLTGNVSGRCPECGMDTQTAGAAMQERG